MGTVIFDGPRGSSNFWGPSFLTVPGDRQNFGDRQSESGDRQVTVPKIGDRQKKTWLKSGHHTEGDIDESLVPQSIRDWYNGTDDE